MNLTTPTASIARMRFSKNYNGKLNNHFFTTIRPDSEKWQVGGRYEVWLPAIPFASGDTGTEILAFRAIIHEKKTLLLHQIPAITAFLDTGHNLKAARDIIMQAYPGCDWATQRLAVLLVENLEWHP